MKQCTLFAMGKPRIYWDRKIKHWVCHQKDHPRIFGFGNQPKRAYDSWITRIIMFR